MKPRYLLDTNIVSYFVRGNFPGLRNRIENTPLESFAISSVTEAELLYWVISRPERSRIRIAVDDILQWVPSLPWDSLIAQRHAILKNKMLCQGKPLSTEDMMIAAHALALDLTLITHDTAFAQVDELRTEDWTIA
jgi:tRNA(fMet)-specific endonuclease VapC